MLRVLLLCVAASCASAAQRRDGPVPSEPLPPIFRGVTWTTTAGELNALFPGAEVSKSTWTCEDDSECVSYSTSLSGWAGFGRARLSVSGPEGRSARLIVITAEDSRAACSLESAHRPADCANSPGP